MRILKYLSIFFCAILIALVLYGLFIFLFVKPSYFGVYKEIETGKCVRVSYGADEDFPNEYIKDPNCTNDRM